MTNYRPSSFATPTFSWLMPARRLRALAIGLLLVAATGAQAAPGDINTIAGTGTPGDAGDNGPAIAALLTKPSKVARDPSSGALYVADAGNDKVRRIAPGGTITTFAGTGVSGFSGDNGPADAAQLRNPQGIAVAANGTVYIADTGNDRIRRVDTSGTITTYAGTGLSGSSGDGGPALAARLNGPYGVAVGADGSVYIADRDQQQDPQGRSERNHVDLRRHRYGRLLWR